MSSSIASPSRPTTTLQETEDALARAAHESLAYYRGQHFQSLPRMSDPNSESYRSSRGPTFRCKVVSQKTKSRLWPRAFERNIVKMGRAKLERPYLMTALYADGLHSRGPPGGTPASQSPWQAMRVSRSVQGWSRESPQVRRENQQAHSRPVRAPLRCQRRFLAGRQPLLAAQQQTMKAQPCSTTAILGKQPALPEPAPQCPDGAAEPQRSTTAGGVAGGYLQKRWNYRCSRICLLHRRPYATLSDK